MITPIRKRTYATMACLSVLVMAGALHAAEPSKRWVHPKCKSLDISRNGPFVQLDDGTLWVVDKNVLKASNDAGKTWKAISGEIDSGMNIGHIGHVGQFIRTKAGTIVIVFLDFDGYKFAWDNAKRKPKPECKLEMWAIRSTDGGKTWTDKQRLLPGYNADFMGLLQTRAGHIVVTVEHLVPELGRWVCCSFRSKDEGKTWKQSNLIDLGGSGHHDGAVEPTACELSDGRLLMMIRTGFGQFWRAYSTDGGEYWRTIEPSGVDASSAPGWILRLADGKLAFVWNRSKAEGAKEVTQKWAGQSFEYPAPGYRQELSLAFSTDDGKTWGKPVVLAREPGGQLAYPYLLERSPGKLWVFTRYTWLPKRKPAPPLKVEIDVKDFAEK